MTTLAPRVLRALEQFHADHPWDHNAHYHQWLLRQLPRHFDSALDVGSGSGDLARLLATRARAVRGIDADPTIVARARELTTPAAPVTFTVGDALSDIPSGSYEMSFPDIVRDARRVLPGARLRRRLFWRYTLVWHQR